MCGWKISRNFSPKAVWPESRKRGSRGKLPVSAPPAGWPGSRLVKPLGNVRPPARQGPESGLDKREPSTWGTSFNFAGIKFNLDICTEHPPGATRSSNRISDNNLLRLSYPGAPPSGLRSGRGLGAPNPMNKCRQIPCRGWRPRTPPPATGSGRDQLAEGASSPPDAGAPVVQLGNQLLSLSAPTQKASPCFLPPAPRGRPQLPTDAGATRA